MAVGMGNMERTRSVPEGGVEGVLNRVGDGEWGNHGAIAERGFGFA